MARSPRKKKERPLGSRRYKRIFHLVCEGAKTEKEYFEWLSSQIQDPLIKLQFTKRPTGRSAPQHLVTDAGRLPALQAGDSIWIILDMDEWTSEQLVLVKKWKNKNARHFAAVSFPKFEYWVLLHGEDDPGLLSVSSCSARFKSYMGSDKGIDTTKLTIKSVRLASQRAREKHQSQYPDLHPSQNFIPMNCGSTLYLLIEQLGIDSDRPG